MYYVHKQGLSGLLEGNVFLCPPNLAVRGMYLARLRRATKARPVLTELAVIGAGISLRCDHRSINLFFTRIHCLVTL